MSRKKIERNDYHHLLWTRKGWTSEYAKLIRNHPCAGAYIPQRTMHHVIHDSIGEIFCPSDKQCKKAYIKLCAYRNDDVVLIHDDIEKKLEVLIKCFKKSKRTARDLQRQLDIIRENRKGG